LVHKLLNCLEFCSHAIRIDKNHRIGLIAEMLSVVACFSGSPPGKAAHQVAHGLVGLQVMRHLDQRTGQVTAECLTSIQEFPIVHILKDGVGDRGSELCEDIRRRHRVQDARVSQLLDGMPGVVIHTESRPSSETF